MDDDGPAFEARALALARAIHDPLGLQGPTILLGQERDGVFISDDAINAFEFTTRRDKAKAHDDAKKLADVLDHLGKDPAHRYKTRTGWFVSEQEPTADQADAVRAMAKSRSASLNAVSYSTLRRRVCDVEGYIASRDAAPFGGAVYAGLRGTSVVDPVLTSGLKTLSVGELASSLAQGSRRVVVGDFGIGKSFTAHLVYKTLRKQYFKSPSNRPFPVHINLRDCAGLRTPAEILRRHAEEIGFSGERGLMSAWRSGSSVLILDGFDEVIPNRLVGAATNLRQVRWEALSPVRRLVAEAPAESGVVVFGRSNYFSSESEMFEAVGMSGAEEIRLNEFTDDQVAEFLSGAQIRGVLPEWLPAKPLFLASMASAGMLKELASLGGSFTAAQAWRELVRMISERESKIYDTVPPETIRGLLANLSVLSRVRESERGELNLDDMKAAFTQVSGRQTDEEALQLLLRLPGLAVAQVGSTEARVFADQGLVDANYGASLAEYISSPYQGHALCEPAAWSTSTADLAVEVCREALLEGGISGSQIVAACDHRHSQGQYDAILLDSIRVADAFGAPPRTSAYIVSDIVADRLEVPETDSLLLRTHIRGSIISELDLSHFDAQVGAPMFENCLIGHLSGAATIPTQIVANFPGTEIEAFDDETATTSGILSLAALPMGERVALSILHKVYAKRGSGRKDSALRRGLPPSSWDYVAPALENLLAQGLLHSSQRGSVTVYLPARARRKEVMAALEAPTARAVADLIAQGAR